MIRSYSKYIYIYIILIRRFLKNLGSSSFRSVKGGSFGSPFSASCSVERQRPCPQAHHHWCSWHNGTAGRWSEAAMKPPPHLQMKNFTVFQATCCLRFTLERNFHEWLQMLHDRFQVLFFFFVRWLVKKNIDLGMESGIDLEVPSWKLTYPSPTALLKMIFLFPFGGIFMLVPCNVTPIEMIRLQAKPFLVSPTWWPGEVQNEFEKPY